MTLIEAVEHFRLDKDKLLYYEKNGLFDCRKQPDGSIDYCDETLEYISLIDLLLKAGLDMGILKTYLKGLGDDKISNEAQIKILIKQRYALLDDIHDKQKPVLFEFPTYSYLKTGDIIGKCLTIGKDLKK